MCINKKSPDKYLKQNAMYPTVYAKIFMKAVNILTTLLLFVGDKILQQIKKCTKTDARRVLETDNWSVMIAERHAFIKFYIL